MNRIFVKPAPGLKVRDPQSLRHLAEEGQHVEENSYWVRRLADGDVVAATPPTEPTAPVKSKEQR